MDDKLPYKQELFALEYIKDLNATRAYKEVYKNCKKDDAAYACASRLLSNAKVKKFIDEELEKMKSTKIADAEEVLEYLTKVMRGESQSSEIVVESVGDYMSEAREVKKSPSEKERLKAAELIGKRYGIYTENLSVKDETKATKILKSISVQLGNKDE